MLAPGPINRGVELTPEVADGPHSAILDQVTNGLAVRMAVLYLLSGKLEPQGPGLRRAFQSTSTTGDDSTCGRSRSRAGRVIDPSQDIDRVADLWLSRGRVLAVGEGLRGGRGRHRRPGHDRLPGPDRHARPPARAGQRGGRDDRHRHRGGPGRRRAPRSPACPTPIPALDSQAAAEFVILQAQRAGKANVYPVGARQQGPQGRGAGRARPARRRRGGRLHRRRRAGRLGLADAAGAANTPDVRPRHHAALPGPRADRRRRDERGLRVDAARPAGDARGGRGHHGRPRHPPGRDHRRPAAHPAHLHRPVASSWSARGSAGASA